MLRRSTIQGSHIGRWQRRLSSMPRGSPPGILQLHECRCSIPDGQPGGIELRPRIHRPMCDPLNGRTAHHIKAGPGPNNFQQ